MKRGRSERIIQGNSAMAFVLFVLLAVCCPADQVFSQTGAPPPPPQNPGAAIGATSGGGPESNPEDKTLSPYFFVRSENPDVDRLPLKSTSADVKIVGVIADVTVTQVYKNEGKKPIEAVYVFPGSTRAAVHGMKMTIGERAVTARIQKREEARATYEQAKKEGKSASLLEQQRPNVFQMNVANILPGDEIKTELRYTELIAPTDGIYEFAYPTVVGPRYSNQPAASAPPSEKWVQNPYTHQGESPTYEFGIAVDLSAGMPIQEMACTSHNVDIDYRDKSRATVKLASAETAGGNRDFILKYRLTGDAVQSGLLLFKGEEENFFLLMMQPPKRVSQSAVPPREYVFIVDVSGSMNGFPLDITKKLMQNLLGGLRPTDSFNVMLFAGGSKLLGEKSLPATPENIQQAVRFVNDQQGGGGTELLPALKRVLALPKREGASRSFVIATDGFVTVETEAFDLIRSQLGDANFFTFGIGSSVNRYLLEGMARVGAGEPFIITKPDEAPEKAEKFRRYIQSPLLTRIKLDTGGFDAYDPRPAAIPDVFAERPVIVSGKWKGEPKGNITLRGLTGEKPYSASIDVGKVKPEDANAALGYLWARSAVTELSDYNRLSSNDARVKEITDLGLKYNLLTAYTSFVAVDTLARRQGGEPETVQQPLPLPEGVSDLAVGGPGAPHPMASRAFSAVPMAPPPPSAGKGTTAGVGSVDSSTDAVHSRKMVREESREAKPEARLDAPQKETERTRAGAGARIRVDDLTVSEGLSEDDVRKVVRERLKEIDACIGNTSGVSEAAVTSVEIVVSWNIGPEGKVDAVSITSCTGCSDWAKKCITDAIKKWRFPKPKGTEKVKATLTFRAG